MGDQEFPQALGGLLEIKGKDIMNSSRNLSWKKVMEAQAKRTWLGSWKQKMNNFQAIKRGGSQQYHSNSAISKTRRNLTRNNALKMGKRRQPRRFGQEGSRRATRTVIERKVRTLKTLIPNGEASMGLDGLFRETAEYISTLQTRVRLMRIMVDALSGSE